MWLTEIVTITYIILSILSLLFSLLAVTCLNNVTYSVFLLAGTYFMATWLLAMLRCEFLALTILLVYLGAIIIFFLFVVMLIPAASVFDSREPSFIEIVSVAAIFLPLFFIIQCRINANLVNSNNFPVAFTTGLSNVEELGLLLYGPFVVPFSLSVFMLLIAIICIIRSVTVSSTK